MVAAFEEDADLGTMVDEVVSGTLADAFESNARPGIPDDLAEVPDMAVVRNVLPVRKRNRLSAVQRDTTFAKVVEIAPLHTATEAVTD